MIEVLHNFEHSLQNEPICLAIGNFDGVHRGHQQILKSAMELSRERELRSFVLTFEPHPDTILRPRKSLRLIQDYNLKYHCIKQFGMDGVLIMPFTRDFSNTPAPVFLERLTQSLNLKGVFVGYDFRFGRGGSGNTKMLFEYLSVRDISVHITKRIEAKEGRISSSGLRKALEEGDLSRFLDWTGRAFCVQGEVSRGDGRGRLIGFPTANLNADSCLLKEGVYAVMVEIPDLDSQFHAGVCNLGGAPTFDQGKRRIEFHLPGKDLNLYERICRVHFLESIRGIQRFESVESLVQQIQRDVDSLEIILPRWRDFFPIQKP